MQEFHDEYYTRFEYLDEPEWLYRRIPVLRKIWMSPVYQRRLFDRLMRRIMGSSVSPILIVAIIVIVICVGFFVFAPQLIYLLSLAPFFLIFFPAITRVVNTVFLRLPTRLKSYFKAAETDPILSAPPAGKRHPGFGNFLRFDAGSRFVPDGPLPDSDRRCNCICDFEYYPPDRTSRIIRAGTCNFMCYCHNRSNRNPIYMFFNLDLIYFGGNFNPS